MHPDRLIQRLEHAGRAFPAILRGITDADARWKPEGGQWSILEITCHLGDEEADDFRARLRLTLDNPSAAWPPIDPEGWAKERDYNSKNFEEAVDRLVNERRASVQWLRSLERPDWSRTHAHPKFGAFSAGSLLASWAAHDALHLRQIAKRLYELARRDAGGQRIDYAGEWRA